VNRKEKKTKKMIIKEEYKKSGKKLCLTSVFGRKATKAESLTFE
jgi:hypothetical protein